MSFDHYYQSLDVQAIENKIIVPDNKLAKLMYYLNCVFNVVKYDVEEKYYNYNNFSLLTKDEEKNVLKLVKSFNPPNMKKLSLFILKPEIIPNGKENEFFEITDKNLGVNINSEVVLEGRVLKVQKVMVCKRSWLYKYYFVPVQEYESPKEQKTAPKYSPPSLPERVELNNVNRFNNYQITERTFDNNDDCCNGCCYRCCRSFLVGVCIVVLIVVWLVAKYYEYFG